jgi:hypothetical protein
MKPQLASTFDKDRLCLSESKGGRVIEFANLYETLKLNVEHHDCDKSSDYSIA